MQPRLIRGIDGETSPLRVRVFQRVVCAGDFFPAGAAGFVFELNIEFFAQPLDGFPEFEVFHLHDEGEAVASFSGTEAFVESAIRVDVERGCFLLCEGAQALEGTTGSLELNVGETTSTRLTCCLIVSMDRWAILGINAP